MNKKAILLVISGFIISACQSYQENPVIGNLQDDSKCPPSGCSDSTPNKAKLSLSVDGGEVIAGLYDSKAEISGKCYEANFEKNQIQVTVYNFQNTALNQQYVYNLASSDRNNIKCINGRFNIAVYTGACGSGETDTSNGCLFPGYSYRVSMTISGDQNTDTNTGSGTANISLKKLNY